MEDENTICSLDLYIETLGGQTNQQCMQRSTCNDSNSNDSFDIYSDLDIFPNSAEPSSSASRESVKSASSSLLTDSKEDRPGACVTGATETSHKPNVRQSQSISVQQNKVFSAGSPTSSNGTGKLLSPSSGVCRKNGLSQASDEELKKTKQELGNWEKRFKELEKKYIALNKNMVSLCLTARMEMKKKDSIIAQLRNALASKEATAVPTPNPGERRDPIGDSEPEQSTSSDCIVKCSVSANAISLSSTTSLDNGWKNISVTSKMSPITKEKAEGAAKREGDHIRETVDVSAAPACCCATSTQDFVPGTDSSAVCAQHDARGTMDKSWIPTISGPARDSCSKPFSSCGVNTAASPWKPMTSMSPLPILKVSSTGRTEEGLANASIAVAVISNSATTFITTTSTPNMPDPSGVTSNSENVLSLVRASGVNFPGDFANTSSGLQSSGSSLSASSSVLISEVQSVSTTIEPTSTVCAASNSTSSVCALSINISMAASACRQSDDAECAGVDGKDACVLPVSSSSLGLSKPKDYTGCYKSLEENTQNLKDTAVTKPGSPPVASSSTSGLLKVKDYVGCDKSSAEDLKKPKNIGVTNMGQASVVSSTLTDLSEPKEDTGCHESVDKNTKKAWLGNVLEELIPAAVTVEPEIQSPGQMKTNKIKSNKVSCREERIETHLSVWSEDISEENVKCGKREKTQTTDASSKCSGQQVDDRSQNDEPSRSRSQETYNVTTTTRCFEKFSQQLELKENKGRKRNLEICKDQAIKLGSLGKMNGQKQIPSGWNKQVKAKGFCEDKSSAKHQNNSNKQAKPKGFYEDENSTKHQNSSKPVKAKGFCKDEESAKHQNSLKHAEKRKSDKKRYGHAGEKKAKISSDNLRESGKERAQNQKPVSCRLQEVKHSKHRNEGKTSQKNREQKECEKKKRNKILSAPKMKTCFQDEKETKNKIQIEDTIKMDSPNKDVGEKHMNVNSMNHENENKEDCTPEGAADASSSMHRQCADNGLSRAHVVQSGNTSRDSSEGSQLESVAFKQQVIQEEDLQMPLSGESGNKAVCRDNQVEELGYIKEKHSFFSTATCPQSRILAEETDISWAAACELRTCTAENSTVLSIDAGTEQEVFQTEYSTSLSPRHKSVHTDDRASSKSVNSTVWSPEKTTVSISKLYRPISSQSFDSFLGVTENSVMCNESATEIPNIKILRGGSFEDDDAARDSTGSHYFAQPTETNSEDTTIKVSREYVIEKGKSVHPASWFLTNRNRHASENKGLGGFEGALEDDCPSTTTLDSFDLHRKPAAMSTNSISRSSSSASLCELSSLSSSSDSSFLCPSPLLPSVGVSGKLPTSRCSTQDFVSSVDQSSELLDVPNKDTWQHGHLVDSDNHVSGEQVKERKFGDDGKGQKVSAYPCHSNQHKEPSHGDERTGCEESKLRDAEVMGQKSKGGKRETIQLGECRLEKVHFAQPEKLNLTAEKAEQKKQRSRDKLRSKRAQEGLTDETVDICDPRVRGEVQNEDQVSIIKSELQSLRNMEGGEPKKCRLESRTESVKPKKHHTRGTRCSLEAPVLEVRNSCKKSKEQSPIPCAHEINLVFAEEKYGRDTEVKAPGGVGGQAAISPASELQRCGIKKQQDCSAEKRMYLTSENKQNGNINCRDTLENRKIMAFMEDRVTNERDVARTAESKCELKFLPGNEEIPEGDKKIEAESPYDQPNKSYFSPRSRDKIMWKKACHDLSTSVLQSLEADKKSENTDDCCSEMLDGREGLTDSKQGENLGQKYFEEISSELYFCSSSHSSPSRSWLHARGSNLVRTRQEDMADRYHDWSGDGKHGDEKGEEVEDALSKEDSNSSFVDLESPASSDVFPEADTSKCDFEGSGCARARLYVPKRKAECLSEGRESSTECEQWDAKDQDSDQKNRRINESRAHYFEEVACKTRKAKLAERPVESNTKEQQQWNRDMWPEGKGQIHDSAFGDEDADEKNEKQCTSAAKSCNLVDLGIGRMFDTDSIAFSRENEKSDWEPKAVENCVDCYSNREDEESESEQEPKTSGDSRKTDHWTKDGPARLDQSIEDQNEDKKDSWTNCKDDPLSEKDLDQFSDCDKSWSTSDNEEKEDVCDMLGEQFSLKQVNGNQIKDNDAEWADENQAVSDGENYDIQEPPHKLCSVQATDNLDMEHEQVDCVAKLLNSSERKTMDSSVEDGEYLSGDDKCGKKIVFTETSKHTQPDSSGSSQSQQHSVHRKRGSDDCLSSVGGESSMYLEDTGRSVCSSKEIIGKNRPKSIIYTGLRANKEGSMGETDQKKIASPNHIPRKHKSHHQDKLHQSSVRGHCLTSSNSVKPEASDSSGSFKLRLLKLSEGDGALKSDTWEDALECRVKLKKKEKPQKHPSSRESSDKHRHRKSSCVRSESSAGGHRHHKSRSQDRHRPHGSDNDSSLRARSGGCGSGKHEVGCNHGIHDARLCKLRDCPSRWSDHSPSRCRQHFSCCKHEHDRPMMSSNHSSSPERPRREERLHGRCCLQVEKCHCHRENVRLGHSSCCQHYHSRSPVRCSRGCPCELQKEKKIKSSRHSKRSLRSKLRGRDNDRYRPAYR